MKKECPFKSNGHFECREEQCAWWIEKQDACAVKAIAISIYYFVQRYRKIYDIYELTEKMKEIFKPNES